MIIKINIDPISKRKIIAICDDKLKGKVYEEGDLQLDLTSKFFDGDLMEENLLLEEMNKCDGLNVVGERSISFCIEKGFIDRNNIQKIKNIPYAFVVVIRDEDKSIFEEIEEENE